MVTGWKGSTPYTVLAKSLSNSKIRAHQFFTWWSQLLRYIQASSLDKCVDRSSDNNFSAHVIQRLYQWNLAMTTPTGAKRTNFRTNTRTRLGLGLAPTRSGGGSSIVVAVVDYDNDHGRDHGSDYHCECYYNYD